MIVSEIGITVTRMSRAQPGLLILLNGERRDLIFTYENDRNENDIIIFLTEYVSNIF